MQKFVSLLHKTFPVEITPLYMYKHVISQKNEWVDEIACFSVPLKLEN